MYTHTYHEPLMSQNEADLSRLLSSLSELYQSTIYTPFSESNYLLKCHL